MLRLTISCLVAAAAVLAVPAHASVKQIKVKDSAFSEACANDRGRPGQCISQGGGGTGQGTYNQYEVCTQTSGTWSCHTVRCPTGNRGNCIVITNNSSPAKAVTIVKRYLDGGRNGQTGSNTPKSPGGGSSASNSSGNGSSGSGQSGGSATVAGGGHAIGGGCSGGVC